MVEAASGLQKSRRLMLLFVCTSLRICEIVFVNTKIVDVWIIEPFACRTLIVQKGEANCAHDVLKLQIVALNSLPYQVLCNGTLIDPRTGLSALPNKMVLRIVLNPLLGPGPLQRKNISTGSDSSQEHQRNETGFEDWSLEERHHVAIGVSRIYL